MGPRRKWQPLTFGDDREFPSLSSNSQPQYQSNNAAIWQRQSQQTPVQRPSQRSQTNPAQQHPQQTQQHPGSPSNDDMFIGSSHLQGSLDDYRQTGQGHLPAPRQPPAQGVDEFPPLGRNGTEGNEADQRGGFGAFTNQNAFASQPESVQSRQGVSAGFGNPPTSTRSSSVVDRTMSPGSYGRMRQPS